MEALLQLADALALESETPPRPDFPLPGELSSINVKEILVHRKSPDKKGMGWFARDDNKQPIIPAGTVLMVAKPLAMAMDWEEDLMEDDDDDDEMDNKDEGDEEAMPKEESHPEPFLNSIIVLRLLKDLQKNPELWTDALAELYPRNEEDISQLPACIKCGDDKMTEQIESIVQELKQHPTLKECATNIAARLPLIVRYNVLSVETGPELLSHPGAHGHANLGGVGLYHKPSFFNHSARPNVARWAVGDVMWFVANQDIPAGAEACISYIEHDILCESSFRRNLMLEMDFEDVSGEEADTNATALEEDGPDRPVVDSEVQNELMEMNSFERLTAIQDLLLQAQGLTPPREGEEDGDNSEGKEAMETAESGWFFCDIQNLRVLKAITLDGLGQTAEALGLWEECVEFTETKLPPLDESAIVMRVQAALCSLHIGDKAHVEKAREHAKKALTMHDKLFGGGAARLRRRYQQDFELPLRSRGGLQNASGVAAADLLWPLTKMKSKRTNGMAPASSLFLLAITMNFFSVSTAFVACYPSLSAPRESGLSLKVSLTESFDELSRQFEDCSVPEIQKLLVQKGSAFQQQQNPIDSTPFQLQSPLDKVPGCVANVHVKTNLIQQCPGDNWDINFEGTADALLSRGLLAVLTTALSSTSNLQEILSVDPYVVADKLAIRRALSPGRNDGVASMTQIIQQQIKALMLAKEGQKENGGVALPLFVDETTKAEPVVSGEVKSEKEGVSPSIKEHDQSSTKKGSVALLLSGGVDSSVALRLLLQQGYAVTAFYLKIWLEDELAHLGQCPWEDDYNVCRQVCEQAGVPLETFSLQEEYRDRVISYTIYEAQRGRTPNPDVLCNSRIKFGCFYDAIEERNFDFVASGHYARLERVNHGDSSDNDGRSVRLFRAPDIVKDQSYFLCALSQEQLQRVIFPLGHLQKAQVRELAEEFQLPNRHRADSQGLCFLGKVKFDEFLGAYLGERPGDILDAATGDILGRHRGVWFHTVGQRKGIGKVLNPLATSRGPWYVVAKDPDHDVVFCSNQYDEDIFAAARSEFHMDDIKWVAGAPPAKMTEDGTGRFDMKIRHGPRIVVGEVTLAGSAGEEGTVKLDQKDGGLAPGQYVVFYEGEECLGGGVISERHWAKFLLDRNESLISAPNTEKVST